MRTRVFAALLAVSALLIALVPVASAAPDPAAEGAPNLSHDSPTGYYIWHNDDGWHLRTHGPNAEHDFVAYLHTNGTFDSVDPIKLEDDDRVDVLDGGHELVLHFHTYDATDGVDFRVNDGEHLRFNLRLDQQLIGTDAIYLGSQGRHPATNPFSVEI